MSNGKNAGVAMSNYCREREREISPRKNSGAQLGIEPKTSWMLVRCSYHWATGARGRGAEGISSIGLSRIQLILSLWAEIPCGQGSEPGWIDCTGTLPEWILSTTSASGSIISNTDWIGGSSSKPTYPIVTVVLGFNSQPGPGIFSGTYFSLSLQ